MATEGSPPLQLLNPQSGSDTALDSGHPFVPHVDFIRTSYVYDTTGAPNRAAGGVIDPRLPYEKAGSVQIGTGTSSSPSTAFAGQGLAAASPFVLRDSSGNPVPGPVAGGEYVPDLLNSTYRDIIAQRIKQGMIAGQAGVWLDNPLNPITDYAAHPCYHGTTTPITAADWDDANASLVEHIRSVNPSAKILVNVLFYSPYASVSGTGTYHNPNWQRIRDAIGAGGGWFNREINPLSWGGSYMVGSNLNQWFDDIEADHTIGYCVDGYPSSDGSGGAELNARREYLLSSYFLISKVVAGVQLDILGDVTQRPGHYVWPGYSMDLGAATSGRVRVGTGNCWKRTFAQGFTALNAPDNSSQTITLPAGTWHRSDGTTVSGSTITLAPGTAINLVSATITPSAPVVASVTPATGSAAGGTSVTIAGSYLSGATGVKFGTNPATSFTPVDSGHITAIAPAATGTVGAFPTTGVLDTFTGSAGALSGSWTNAFDAGGSNTLTKDGSGNLINTLTNGYSDAAWSSSFAADQEVWATIGAGGGKFMLAARTAEAGGHFTGIQAEFNGYNGRIYLREIIADTLVGGADYFVSGASYWHNTGDRIGLSVIGNQAVVHYKPVGGADAIVTTQTVTTSGAGKAWVSIDWTGFSLSDFGGGAVVTGGGITGTVDVTVTTPYGTSTAVAGDHFTYVPVPAITSVSPTSGTAGGGTAVTVNGTNLTAVTSVLFGSTAATSLVVVSDTQVTCVAPPGSGTVDITARTSATVSPTGIADRYSYTAIAAPVVTGVTPDNGTATGGTAVTITGTGFTGASGVQFGATNAPTVSVTSDTSITVTAPAGVAGASHVVVLGVGGPSPTGTADLYTYTGTPDPSPLALTVTSSATPTQIDATLSFPIRFGTDGDLAQTEVDSDRETLERVDLLTHVEQGTIVDDRAIGVPDVSFQKAPLAAAVYEHTLQTQETEANIAVTASPNTDGTTSVTVRVF